MGRIFSQSQGKFIDQEEQVSGDATVGGQPDFKQAALIDLLTTGGKNVSKINTVADLFKPEEVKEDKNKSSLNATTNFINILEERFSQAGGGEYEGAGARISGVKKSAAGLVGLDENTKVYNDARKGFAATLKQLTGDTGVLTDSDYKRLAGLLPSIGSTSKEAEAKFNDLRRQLASKFGGEVTSTNYQAPETKGGALAATAPDLNRYFKEVVPEHYEKGYQGYGTQLKQALGLMPDAYKAAEEVVAPFILLSEFKKLAGKSAIGSVNKAVQNRATKAAETKAKFSGKKMVEVGEEFVSRDPTAKNVADKVLTPLKNKNFSGTELIDQMKVWSKAYTSAGKTGKSAKAGLYDVLIREAKDQLAKKAPEVLQAHLQLAKKLGFRSSVKRLVYPTAIGAGVAGGVGFGIRKATGQ